MKVNFGVFLLVVFAVATYTGWGWPDIAKIMPVYVAAIPGLLMIVIQLYREVTNWEAGQGAGSGTEMDDFGNSQLDKTTSQRRTIMFFAWFIGGALGIWLIGIVYALPLLVFLYALVEGQEKWFTSLILGGGAYLLLWGLFEYMLETRWPSGLLFGY